MTKYEPIDKFFYGAGGSLEDNFPPDREMLEDKFPPCESDFPYVYEGNFSPATIKDIVYEMMTHVVPCFEEHNRIFNHQFCEALADFWISRCIIPKIAPEWRLEKLHDRFIIPSEDIFDEGAMRDDVIAAITISMSDFHETAQSLGEKGTIARAIYEAIKAKAQDHPAEVDKLATLVGSVRFAKINAVVERAERAIQEGFLHTGILETDEEDRDLFENLRDHLVSRAIARNREPEYVNDLSRMSMGITNLPGYEFDGDTVFDAAVEVLTWVVMAVRPDRLRGSAEEWMNLMGPA